METSIHHASLFLDVWHFCWSRASYNLCGCLWVSGGSGSCVFFSICCFSYLFDVVLFTFFSPTTVFICVFCSRNASATTSAVTISYLAFGLQNDNFLLGGRQLPIGHQCETPNRRTWRPPQSDNSANDPGVKPQIRLHPCRRLHITE